MPSQGKHFLCTLLLIIGGTTIWIGFRYQQQRDVIRLIDEHHGYAETVSIYPLWADQLLLNALEEDATDGFRSVAKVSLRHASLGERDLLRMSCLKDLEILYLHGTQVTDAGIRHLEGLTKLEQLDLSNTKISDAGLEHLRQLANLQSLDISDTQLTDAGLQHLTCLSGLELLDLSNTDVSDAGMEHLSALTSLEVLAL